jgi:hypothetical protein
MYEALGSIPSIEKEKKKNEGTRGIWHKIFSQETQFGVNTSCMPLISSTVVFCMEHNIYNLVIALLCCLLIGICDLGKVA